MINIPQRWQMPEFDERLVILTSDGFPSVIPYPYALSGTGDIKYRAKAEAKAYNHGATVSGDGKADSRQIKLDIDISGCDEDVHDRAANELVALFGQRDYQVITGRTDRRYNVARLIDSKHDFYKGFKQRRSKFTFTLLLADPFRYAARETVFNFVYGAAQIDTVIKIPNHGSAPDTPLKIIVIPEESMMDVRITHLNTGRNFRMTDSVLSAPRYTTIDTKAGTVIRTGLNEGDLSNAINTYSGHFLTVLPGINQYKINIAPGSLQIAFTERFLI